MTHEPQRIELATATPVMPTISPLQDRGFYVHYGLKRSFDILASAVLILVTLPLIGIFWLCVRRDGGPGFYGQERVGRGGRVFRCWKLRSMCVDAQACLAAHLEADAAAAVEWQATQKLADDPRITRLGHVIRKYSIDELPQFWNVLRGDMSLIGPRPVRADELELYGADRVSYLKMRPGISGLWQVSGRNEISYAERVALDVRYARSVSLWMDIRIALATLRVVVRGTGQ